MSIIAWIAARRVYRVAIIPSTAKRVKRFAYKTSNLLGHHGMHGGGGVVRMVGRRGWVITPALKGNGIKRSPCVRFTSLYRLSRICFDYTVETHGNFGGAINR